MIARFLTWQRGTWQHRHIAAWTHRHMAEASSATTIYVDVAALVLVHQVKKNQLEWGPSSWCC